MKLSQLVFGLMFFGFLGHADAVYTVHDTNGAEVEMSESEILKATRKVQESKMNVKTYTKDGHLSIENPHYLVEGNFLEIGSSSNLSAVCETLGYAGLEENLEKTVFDLTKDSLFDLSKARKVVKITRDYPNSQIKVETYKGIAVRTLVCKPISKRY